LKFPFTGAVLQSASRSNTRIPWADHRGRLVGRSVGRSVVSNFTHYLGVQIHSLGRRASQAVGIAKCVCEHTSLTHLTTSTKYTCGLSIGINVIPGF